ncbi:aspartate aminotransferase/aromatic-amino-acid transaminase [Devosia subaequoris]|uniref:Aspartate aminotransferase/aromatic-amino-acid transaminase n=1 Tax=Devosia subaequoris TaxID=395930 RepID=A0A7W6NCP7_9HYPH|nr:amino acid aminotransferase [Devosia subaequoris]MBB4053158.1 aspartate aminotransferase/aromatic-amino-acid transaminase [Devosia subaequoris]MCP1210710.1 aspartate/tyrosine/aromatic aminotransferase [Devosia subaequoris]
MFETLSKAPGDKILALMGEYAADSRPTKIDLGVGVYKDEKGVTPIMSSVRKAEQRMLSNEKTKSYLGIAGNKGFGAAVLDLVLADSVDRARVRVAQAPGGTGSLWVLMQLVNRARPGATVHVSDPTWANHNPIAIGSGLKVATYPYFDPATRAVKFDDMLAALDKLGAGDVVLLHGCCHNPTGANLSDAQWDQVAQSLARTGALPFIDLAYLGFGDGIEPDAYGTRKILASVPEALIAFSGSKNFGLYRERIGAAILVARDGEQADVTNSQLLNIIRGAYSQPPDHGAEIIRTILEDADLRAEWETELAEMRDRMIVLREKLAAAIRERSNSSDFDFVADHRGMFSLLGLPVESVDHLKAENGVYMTSDSRINIAGIPEDRVGDLADAVLAAIR